MAVVRAQTCKCQLEWTEAEDTGQWKVEHHSFLLFIYLLIYIYAENR